MREPTHHQEPDDERGTDCSPDQTAGEAERAGDDEEDDPDEIRDPLGDDDGSGTGDGHLVRRGART